MWAEDVIHQYSSNASLCTGPRLVISSYVTPKLTPNNVWWTRHAAETLCAGPFFASRRTCEVLIQTAQHMSATQPKRHLVQAVVLLGCRTGSSIHKFFFFFSSCFCLLIRPQCRVGVTTGNYSFRPVCGSTFVRWLCQWPSRGGVADPGKRGGPRCQRRGGRPRSGTCRTGGARSRLASFELQ